jgi:hypothetical protein
MSLTRKDIEEIERKPFKEPPFTNFFVSMLRFLSKIPPVKRYLNESIGGLSGRIFRLWETKEYEEATKVAIFGIEKYRHKKSKTLPFMDHHHWWQLMKHGVDSAKNTDNQELKDKLIEYAVSGIEPFEGYDVANTYLEFSKWQYQKSEYEKAIEFAKIASKADSTWAEPDFILGWYGLVLGQGDVETHLSHAIEKDPRILFRVANNDICQQYPHIIKKLKEKYSEVPNESQP